MAPGCIRLDQTAWVLVLVLPYYYASRPKFALAAAWGRSPSSPGLRPASVEWKWGAFYIKGLFQLLFCKIFFKATGPRSTQSNSTEASPTSFSLEKLLPKDKVNWQTEGTFLLLCGGNVQSSMYTYIHTHQIVAAVGVFSYKQILREKSKVLQPCTVYIY